MNFQRQFHTVIFKKAGDLLKLKRDIATFNRPSIGCGS